MEQTTAFDFETAEENIFWQKAETIIEDLCIDKIKLIEEISIHLEGKMDEILHSVTSMPLPPQEQDEALDEALYMEICGFVK